VIELNSGAISPVLVTKVEFAQFVRTDAYFCQDFWPLGAEPPEAGGDALLRRLGFRWKDRERPVTGVSWYEATAYCKWRGGRLPYYPEWQKLVASALIGSARPEWCSDWYNPHMTGPKARPVSMPYEKRVAGWNRGDRANPSYTGHSFGFRVVFDEPPCGDVEGGVRVLAF